MDKEKAVEKNFCIVVFCDRSTQDDCEKWRLYYGPYTRKEAQGMLAELNASYSPMTNATVIGFSVEELKPKTIAKINADVDKINAENNWKG